jgi:C1A family cysteine protease
MKVSLLAIVFLFSSVSCEWVKSSERRIFKGLNFDQLRTIMRPLEKVTLQNHHGYLALDNITLPSHFSWRENFTACMVPVIDQGECGSCYAHAVTSMMAERICIIEN